MSEERKKILTMLAEGKINADEADQLLAAIEPDLTAGDKKSVHSSSTEQSSKRTNPKFLHVQIHSEGRSGRRDDNLNVKIPLNLLKAGMKIGSLMPDKTKDTFNKHMSESGLNIDLNKLDSDEIDRLIQALKENAIEVNSDKDHIRIYCG